MADNDSVYLLDMSVCRVAIGGVMKTMEAVPMMLVVMEGEEEEVGLQMVVIVPEEIGVGAEEEACLEQGGVGLREGADYQDLKLEHKLVFVTTSIITKCFNRVRCALSFLPLDFLFSLSPSSSPSRSSSLI